MSIHVSVPSGLAQRLDSCARLSRKKTATSLPNPSSHQTESTAATWVHSTQQKTSMETLVADLATTATTQGGSGLQLYPYVNTRRVSSRHSLVHTKACGCHPPSHVFPQKDTTACTSLPHNATPEVSTNEAQWYQHGNLCVGAVPAPAAPSSERSVTHIAHKKSTNMCVSLCVCVSVRKSTNSVLLSRTT